MPISGEIKNIPPKLQADAVLNQANPVSGTKYTVLNTVKNVRIKSIAAKVTWTVQPTPLEIHATIDGIAMLWLVGNPVSGTNYFASDTPQATALLQTLGLTAYDQRRGFLLEARSIKIEAEITGGTSDPLEARAKSFKY